MSTSMFIRVDEVSELLGISKSHTYKIIKRLNSELEECGYVTVAGRVDKRYFHKRFYGLGAEE